MADHYEKYKLQLAKAIVGKGSYMNNTKWHKFFHMVVQKAVSVREFHIKFLLSENLHPHRIVGFEFDNNGILDGANGGPLKYNEIEYLQINSEIIVPRQNREEFLTPFIIQQDIVEVNSFCSDLGQFEIEYLPNEWIKIFGYK